MAPYEIVVDDAKHAVRAMLHGFWNTETASRYLAELALAAARVARGRNPNWWLIDMTDAQVQSRDVAAMMSSRLPGLFPPTATVAIVIDASLPALQAKRVAQNQNHHHFVSRAEAERWLADQGMSA